MMNSAVQPTRSRKAERTRDAILAAARALFAADSYDDVGVRDIGMAAGIDPALVIRYFGSKERLFAEALETGAEDMDLFNGTPEEFSERAAGILVEPKDGAKLQSFLMMLQSATSQKAAHLTEQYLDRRLREPLKAWRRKDYDPVQAQLVLSVILGTALSRTISPHFKMSQGEKRKLQTALKRLLIYCLDTDL
ncbi:TetR/AcrR family transcriptional regulator [Hyphococcus luteus]|uniref:HTH tetR-type domain-containing protein n=1 Tax=Hyphococcus luteus TaxID=2058213 RepID=A0A2S7K2B5_9PROT|nr:TetR/AcrR family transcriptional regulator [Marinicaulis flavus]PQA86642.1 hypothetical protein CW354_16050 [Marinicaulis flavus]